MSIEQNIYDRERAERLHRTIGELLCDEVPVLPSDQSRVIFWKLMLESVKKQLTEEVAYEIPAQPKIVTVKPTSEGTLRYALELVGEINEMADEVAWPDAPDVCDKANDIGAVIEKTGHVTDGQLNALHNMRNGMAAWMRD